MVLSLAAISSFYGGLSDSIRVQTNSVNDYYDEFMAYAQEIQVTDPGLLVPCFIKGLKSQIQQEVLCKNPRSLLEAWFKARICELKLKEDVQPIPEFQAQIQQNSDPQFQVQIQPAQASENQNSESEINEGDTATIQDTCSEFTKNIKPQLKSKNQNRSQFQSQEDEYEDEIDEMSIYSEFDDRSATVVKQRQPPEPPDMNSLTEESFLMQMPACQNLIEAVEESGLSNGTEDDALTKAKVVDDDVAEVNGDGRADYGEYADRTTGSDFVEAADLSQERGTVVPAYTTAAGGTTTLTAQDVIATVKSKDLLCHAPVVPKPPLMADPTMREQEEAATTASGVGSAGRRDGRRVPWRSGGWFSAVRRVPIWLEEELLTNPWFKGGDATAKGMVDDTAVAGVGMAGQKGGGEDDTDGVEVVPFLHASKVASSSSMPSKLTLETEHGKEELLTPAAILGLGLQGVYPAQHQIQHCGPTIGPMLRENYFGDLMDSIFFKQWDPGGI